MDDEQPRLWQDARKGRMMVNMDTYYDPPEEWECPECGSVWLDSGGHYCEDCGYEEYDPSEDEPADFDEKRFRLYIQEAS